MSRVYKAFGIVLIYVILLVIIFNFVTKKDHVDAINNLWLGIQVLTIDNEVIKNFNLVYKHGLLVRSVISGSPADNAGIIENDIIRLLGGQRILDTSQLKEYINAKSTGDKIRIVYIRNGITKTTYAVLEEMPKIDPNSKLVYGAYPTAAPPTNKPYPYFYFGEEEEE